VELSSTPLDTGCQGNPNAVFIFQIGSSLTTLGGRKVILAGGAQARNIFCNGSSATLGTTSVFKGSIHGQCVDHLAHLASLEPGTGAGWLGDAGFEYGDGADRKWSCVKFIRKWWFGLSHPGSQTIA